MTGLSSYNSRGPQRSGIESRPPPTEGRSYSGLGPVRLGAILGILTILLIGCGAAGVETGIYVIQLPDGAPGWIGEPEGIPAWSPVDEQLAWGNEDGLFLAGPDEGVRQLVDVPIGGRPAWSPDGKAIAFINRELAQLVVIDAESGIVEFDEPVSSYGVPAPPQMPVILGGPSWAPDGSNIAFVCFDGAGDEVCIIEEDGTGRRQVTHLDPLDPFRRAPNAPFEPAASNAGPPSWSPDSSSLAVAAYPERTGGSTGVFIVDVAKGSARRISDLLPNSPIGWFPNGRSVYFSSTQPDRSDITPDRSDVFHVYVRAGLERNLTQGLEFGSRNPALSPDGTRLATESNGEVVILTEQTRPQEFGVPELRATYPTWSSDGSAIAISAVADPILIYN